MFSFKSMIHKNMHYNFSYNNPQSHFINIELSIDTGSKDSITLHLPSWRPGRYEIANFAKNILNVCAEGSKNNKLSCEKISKDSWEVGCANEKKIKIIYQYYAFAMDAGNSWLDEEQLYLNFINCAMYAEGYQEVECSVSLSVPNDYKCATGLEQVTQHEFRASSYYQLVDSPLIASNSLRKVTYRENSTNFNLWIQGDLPKTNEELIHDFERFTKTQIEAMGEFPCEEYHFLFQCLPYTHYHGVEHFNSTTITIGPSNELAERPRYKKLLGVSCHELFHTWNVIRLRPEEMVPYDFKKENYHKTGFITEGVTTYYGDLFLAQSGVFSVEEYLEELNGLLKRHYENEGRKNMSVAASSFDLWIDGYQPGIPGRKVSIYNEGALAALMLDLTIRLKWNHEKSLDNVMREMWAKHGKDFSGYSAEDYQNAAEKIYGASLQEYFDDYVFGTKPFETTLKPLLETCGLSFELSESNKSEERNFGFRTIGNKITQIDSGSPSASVLSLKDEILKVNGEDFSSDTKFEGAITMEVNRFSKIKQIDLAPTDKQYFSIYQVAITSDKPNGNLKKWLCL
jgi:predicted metalloprotease with PDZ domain